MICNYANRVSAHSDRFGSIRTLPPLWVVVHTSEGSEGESSAENLASYLTTPGDRPNGRGGTYGSSYHAIADTDLRVIPVVPDNRVAFAASGANTEGLHIVIPGRAEQTRDEWLSGSSLSAITTVAGYILDAFTLYGIPTERVSMSEVRASTRGYCDHATISAAFGRSSHWDVGPSFPWDVLHSEIRRLANQTEETEMTDEQCNRIVQAIEEQTKAIEEQTKVLRTSSDKLSNLNTRVINVNRTLDQITAAQ